MLRVQVRVFSDLLSVTVLHLVKPENLLLRSETDDMSIKLADFG
jgi:hypothetical protein